MFTESGAPGFVIGWSNFSEENYIEKLQKKIDRLIQKREKSILEENSNSKPAVKPKKR